RLAVDAETILDRVLFGRDRELCTGSDADRMAVRDSLCRLHHRRCKGMGLALAAEADEARVREGGRGGRRVRDGSAGRDLLPQARRVGRAVPGRGGREAAIDDRSGKADGLEELAAAVARE